MSEILHLELSYYEHRRSTKQREADCRRRVVHWGLPTEQVALVCVDVWSEHYIQTHVDRTTEITLERIVPVQEAFRRLGALVVHGPSPDCARKYPEWLEEEIEGSQMFVPAWPPSEFRRKEGDYADFVRPCEQQSEEFDQMIRERSIVPEAAPRGDDRVVVDGEALHRLLVRRGGLFLFYVGFAANMCVPFRDYGMRAMKDRGYDIILVEDCTTAIEVADSAGDLALSRACKIDAALTVGYTANSVDLLVACHRVGA
ncbi:MAG: isochorismatase family protein [Candidatus Latescibacterota bacterium]|nr:isochorismatase family protein [Candidatus Latescibacterota bacterium]